MSHSSRNFNKLSKFENAKALRVLPNLKVQIKDVFKNIWHQSYNGLFDEAFNLDELPNYNSITEEELKHFVEVIKNTFKNKINVNEATGTGPVDYLVKHDDFVMLINEAELEDFTKGIAQNIMQLHSASEELHPEPLFGSDDSVKPRSSTRTTLSIVGKKLN
ncbi:9688_t:CDS:2 [Entrophospora sp. SA101]|nr:9688_t:CDS:2 [Entrophospora sp. SA101]